MKRIRLNERQAYPPALILDRVDESGVPLVCPIAVEAYHAIDRMWSVVELDDDEAYRMYIALKAHYESVEADSDNDERFLREYGCAESSSQLPWNRNQTEEYLDLIEHAPSCDCPSCRPGEPDDIEDTCTVEYFNPVREDDLLVHIEDDLSSERLK